MSGNNLTVESQFRYIIQWFNEWSELQREDFLPILIEYLTKDDLNPAIYMNGVVSSMANLPSNDKPMSLFQCRIKLFKEWSKKWPEDFKNKLKGKIIEIDPKYGEKLMEDLQSLNNGNGRSSEDEEEVVDEDGEEEGEEEEVRAAENIIVHNEVITQSA